MLRSLVGSEMCIRDRVSTQSTGELAATAPKPVAAGHVGTVRPEICVFRAVNPGVATVMFQQRQVANGGIMKLHRFEVRVRLVEDLFRIGCTGPGTRCGIM
eukprot:TRINITY_DN10483_c0_g1_i2.p2 TRINITY_DN10483_c0_g1~~TRINITY_DN10483_c0_g1_i2.p2  ORF type:complete len:101 (+),score=21.30 TRINITY_DN10483_c0_g1_i2:129-431(+)